ncbi:MAG TPA: 2,3-diketo-L-gulonate reductase, partial [Epulopiscium sp.]|nr:2,3-diketo-L-gulonate reductase [Candidatus Epulonipiscium sp.]
MRIQYDEMLMRFKRVLMEKGFLEADALNIGEVFTKNSLDGIYSHGVNRFSSTIGD